METEVGWVKAIEGGYAVIRLRAGAQCGRCGAKMVCAAGKGLDRELKIPNQLYARVGDQVEISYSESSRILQAFLLFILPIFFLLAGYAVARSLYGTEGAAAIGAFLGLLLSLALLRVLNRVAEKRQAYLPRMVRIVQSGGEATA